MSEKKQVLIICNSSAGQMYLGVLLDRLWYTPVLAQTPAEGTLLARSNSFSLVLLDGDAPALDLPVAVNLVRNDPFLSTPPLVVFLSDHDRETHDSLLAWGSTAVITKPLDLAIAYGVLARLSGQPRTAHRVSVTMRVEIEEGRPAKELMSVNISEGGLYLSTPDPLPEGTILHVKFTLPREMHQIELSSEVVRTLRMGTQREREPGMGLRFTEIPGDDLQRIRNFIQWELMGDLEWKPSI